MAVAGGWCRGRLLGRGSSATVSLATAVDSGEVFAVKSAPLCRAGALRKEQRILSALDSPYVVSCLGSRASGDSYDLFLEYAPGGSLADEAKRRGGRLDEAAVGFFLCDVVRGLAYLHSRGVVHCDVKGQNVLIGAEGRAKVADFGCARVAEEDEERGQFGGTPMFMAPEVARGEEQGAPADVWALGCTAVEMATGRAPWPQAADPVAVLHRIAFSADVPDFPSWFSDEGKDFLSRCLCRDPSERWTAEQLLDHPFVASAANSQSKANATGDVWVSPKSTLDQAFWESLSEEDDDFEQLEEPTSAAADMFHQLIADGAGVAPNWTWDEGWTMVRGLIPESCQTMEGAAVAVENTVGSDSSINEASTDGTSRSDTSHGLITFSSNRVVTSSNYATTSTSGGGTVSPSVANAAQLNESNVQPQQQQLLVLPHQSCELLINNSKICEDDSLVCGGSKVCSLLLMPGWLPLLFFYYCMLGLLLSPASSISCAWMIPQRWVGNM